jgi:hypothetical protein
LAVTWESQIDRSPPRASESRDRRASGQPRRGEIFRQAAEVGRRGIRADMAKVPKRLVELLEEIESRLFEKEYLILGGVS